MPPTLRQPQPDKGVLARLSDELGIQATLRVDLTGEVFNGVSIQVSHNQADGQQDKEEDIPTRIKTLEEVVAISPMRQHPKPPVIPSRPLPTGVFKRQRLGKNNSLSAHLMAQIDYTHPALGGCLGKGCLVSFSREWLEDDDKNNPDAACKSHATALAGVIAAQEAEATEVLSVGSVDNMNTRVLANVSTYTYSGSNGKVSEFAWRDGEPGSGATGWGDVTLPLWSGLNFSNRSDQCRHLIPKDAVPDLSHYILLRPRAGGGCSDVDLANRAGERGAAYVIIVDDDNKGRIEIPRVDVPALRAIAMTDKRQGDEWLQLLQSGDKDTLNMTASKTRELIDGTKRSGGRMSGFSAWGPTYDGYAPTSVAAPGDDLLTTEAGGGYVITGGTSLSAPFAAAVAALVAEARGTKDWRVLRSLLSITAKPTVRDAPADIFDKPGLELASVAQQGGGLVQAMNAIRAPCEISVHKILFNDTTNRQKATFTIRNPTPDAITYDLANSPAGTVYTFMPNSWQLGNYGDLTNNLYTSDAAELSYPKTGARVTVAGNGALNGSDGFDYTIPYMGLAGSIDATPAMHSLTWQRADGSTIEPGGTLELAPGSRGRLAFELGLAPRRVVTELRDAATDKVVGDLPMKFGQMAYSNGGYWEWTGDFKNSTRVPEGEYVAVARSQAAFMPAEDMSGWQQAASPPVKIKWTG
ncbi:peptidase S8/S53 domain-containing protein [Apiospora arundinis]